MSQLKSCFNLDDFRVLAKSRLPRMIFDYLDGGSDDEVTLRRNQDSFSKIQLMPRVLRNVENIDLSTMVLGQKVDIPLLLSPTGQTRMFHHSGEVAVARAAARAGTIYSLSSVSSTSIEDTAAASGGCKWFQIYVWRDRQIIREFMTRCRKSGYHALCLTVDLPVHGNRERDLRNRLTFPAALTLKTAMDVMSHPRWLYHYLTSPKIEIANVASSAKAAVSDGGGLMDYISRQFDSTVDWDDVAWMIEQWDGPFLIKGIVNPQDARRAVEIGASGIIISNHGGRQLDSMSSTIEVLPQIVQAVAGRAEILLDGGVRRGTDVIKALALGATAVMIGRPYLYALAAGGEEGVDRMFELIRAEIIRDMALLGCTKISQLTTAVIFNAQEIG
ncbi:MAG: alpha-hydroxy-acid oxidizing enzyme [Alphaproteobacteria bacterium]|nr:MAG: alpha-hydroxy-acid oxidizing enzyme [Alphaproteobacteria bacterium]